VIAVSGASGYVGGRILAHLRAGGEEVLALVRRPQACEAPARRFALAEPLAEGALVGVEAVVHAAWDLAARGPAVRELNVAGSLPLLDAAAATGARLVFISTLAAFTGARSDYGRAKLALEREVLDRGGVVLRPGVVFGMRPQGIFGELVRSVSGHRVVPLVGGSGRLFLSHDEHLCELVASVLRGGVAAPEPLFAAHELPTTLRGLTDQIAAAGGHSPRVIPLPAAPVYGVLRALEVLGVGLPYRSDSLRSLINPAPLDQLAALARGPVRFPPFSPDLWRS
jgi:nucleoside-diphosphate-sugar epimerase